MNKIILYGAGTKGKELFKVYKDRVVAFIDNDRKKQGTLLNDIPIISLETYLERYKNIPIVIAVLNSKDIFCTLKEHGIHNYFVDDLLFKANDVCQDNIIDHDHWVDFLSDKFNRPGVSILEVGSRVVTGSCNRDKFNKADYVGFDYYFGDNVDIVGDAHRLSDYFNQKFDLIFCSSVFEHLAMPWKVSKEMIKLLKLNGYVFIETHYCYGSHERPWHFFQFSENALDVLFPEKFGMICERKGCCNLIDGKFSEYSSEYLRGSYVNGLYCHSEYFGKKVRNVDDMSWDNISLEDVAKGTQYPHRNN